MTSSTPPTAPSGYSGGLPYTTIDRSGSSNETAPLSPRRDPSPAQGLGTNTAHPVSPSSSHSPSENGKSAKLQAPQHSTSRWSQASLSQGSAQMPKGWPSAPSKQRTPLWIRIVSMAWDILVTLASIVFIAIAIAARALDNKPLSPFGQVVLGSQDYSPTAFPVLFAAVVGRLMTNAARWKAQRGAALGLLEQLNGSQSWSTAFERLVLLRRFCVIGIAIVVLWTLSPVGGQSTLRILTTKPSNVTEQTNLRYLNTDMAFDDNWGANAFASLGWTAAAVFQGTLLSAAEVRLSPVDTWTNVKIPMIETLDDTYHGVPWRTIEPATVFNYSSLIGITIVGLPSKGLSNFSVESSYTIMDTCIFGRTPNATAWDRGLGPLLAHQENSRYTPAWSGTPSPSDSSGAFPAPFWVDSNAAPLSSTTSPNLLFVITSPGGRGLSEAMPGGPDFVNCSTRTTRVESNVVCSGTDCAVRRIRYSAMDTRPNTFGPFDFDKNDAFIPLSNMLLGFPYIAGQRSTTASGMSNPITTYLNDSNSVIYSYESGTSGYDLAKTIPEAFALGFTQLWNTYLQTLWSPFFISGGAPQRLEPYEGTTSPAGVGYVSGGRYAPFVNKDTTAEYTREGPRLYKADRTWIGIMLAISIVMQICAVLGTILRYFCRTPHILGHVSSLTRDNPHVPLPPGGTTLDGLERSRLLKDMVVQVGDVKRGSSVGHISLKSGITEPMGQDKRREYF